MVAAVADLAAPLSRRRPPPLTFSTLARHSASGSGRRGIYAGDGILLRPRQRRRAGAARPPSVGDGAWIRLVSSGVEAVAAGGGAGFASNRDIFFMYSLTSGGFCSGAAAAAAVPFGLATPSCLPPPNPRPQQARGKEETKFLDLLGFMWNPLSWAMEANAIMYKCASELRGLAIESPWKAAGLARHHHPACHQASASSAVFASPTSEPGCLLYMRQLGIS